MIKQNYADRKELQDWYGKKILKELPDVNSNNILTKENMHLKDVVEMVCSASVTELCDLLFLPRKVLVQKYRTIKKYDELCVFTGYHKYWEKRVRSQFPGQRKKQKEERKKRVQEAWKKIKTTSRDSKEFKEVLTTWNKLDTEYLKLYNEEY